MNLKKMLPFLDEESKDELIEQIINKEIENFNIVLLYPFINTNQKKLIMNAILDKKIGASLTALLPFLSKESMDALIDKIKEGDYETVDMDMLLPFLDNEQIKKVFKEAINKHKNT